MSQSKHHRVKHNGLRSIATAVSTSLLILFLAARASAQTPAQSVSVPSVPSWFAYCAGENGRCNFAGQAQVIWGASNGNNPVPPPVGTFLAQTVTGGTTCSNAVFGDAAPGVSKACWFGPVSGLQPGKILSSGGSDYPFYVQNSQLWDFNKRSVVGLYHLYPTLVESQLRQMYKSGQTKITLVIWYMPFDSPTSPVNAIPTVWPDVYDSVLNASGGHLSTQAQQNLKDLLALIKAIGFNHITLRLGPQGIYQPTKWGNTWNEAAFQAAETFTFNTRQLMESALAGSSIQRVYDLGMEEGGFPHYPLGDGTFTDGQSSTWTTRMWADYVARYGKSDSYGFTIAYSYGTLASAIAAFDRAGTRPNSYAIDSANPPDVWYVYQELVAAGETAKPIVMQEMPYNDFPQVQAIQNELQHVPLTISYIQQWPNSTTSSADDLTPPTNFGALGGTTTPSGTIVGYACTPANGQNSCTTQVSWATSNSSNVALYVNGVKATNSLTNMTTTLSGSTTVTLTASPTTFLLQTGAGSANPVTLAQMTLAAITGNPPTLTNAGLGGSAFNYIWALGANISANCSANLYDPNNPTNPLQTVTNVSCQAGGISFQIPAAILNNYAALNFTIVNSNGQSSQPYYVQLQTSPTLSLAGTGGNANQSIWAIGASISPGCSINLYDPNSSLLLQTVTAVSCESYSLSFAVPAAILSNYTALNVSVTNSNSLTSAKIYVRMR